METKHISYYNNTSLINTKLTKIDNLIHGNKIGFYRSGKLKYSEKYQYGKLDGRQFDWFESGQIRFISNYVNNRLHGPQYEYDEKGLVKNTTYYDHGKLL